MVFHQMAAQKLRIFRTTSLETLGRSSVVFGFWIIFCYPAPCAADVSLLHLHRPAESIDTLDDVVPPGENSASGPRRALLGGHSAQEPVTQYDPQLAVAAGSHWIKRIQERDGVGNSLGSSVYAASINSSPFAAIPTGNGIASRVGDIDRGTALAASSKSAGGTSNGRLWAGCGQILHESRTLCSLVQLGNNLRKPPLNADPVFIQTALVGALAFFILILLVTLHKWPWTATDRERPSLVRQRTLNHLETLGFGDHDILNSANIYYVPVAAIRRGAWPVKIITGLDVSWEARMQQPSSERGHAILSLCRDGEEIATVDSSLKMQGKQLGFHHVRHLRPVTPDQHRHWIVQSYHPVHLDVQERSKTMTVTCGDSKQQLAEISLVWNHGERLEVKVFSGVPPGLVLLVVLAIVVFTQAGLCFFGSSPPVLDPDSSEAVTSPEWGRPTTSPILASSGAHTPPTPSRVRPASGPLADSSSYANRKRSNRKRSPFSSPFLDSEPPADMDILHDSTKAGGHSLKEPRRGLSDHKTGRLFGYGGHQLVHDDDTERLLQRHGNQEAPRFEASPEASPETAHSS